MSLIARLLRLISLVACLVIIVSFSFFATDLAGQATDAQRAKIADSLATDAPDEQRRERASGAFREGVDDANDVLVAPFTPLVEGRNIWLQRIGTGLLGLLLYGLGLGIIANIVRK